MLKKRKLGDWRSALRDVQTAIEFSLPKEKISLTKEKSLIEKKIKKIKETFLGELIVREVDTKQNFRKIAVKDIRLKKVQKFKSEENEVKQKNLKKANIPLNETKETKETNSEFLHLKDIDNYKKKPKVDFKNLPEEQSIPEEPKSKPKLERKVSFGSVEILNLKKKRGRIRRTKTLKESSPKPILRRSNTIELTSEKEVVKHEDDIKEEILEQTVKKAMKQHLKKIKKVSSASEFEKLWRSIAADKESKTLFLEQISVSKLLTIFKNGFDFELLLSIIKTFPLLNNNKTEAEFYRGLLGVKKIKMTMMMLTKKEKQFLRERIDHLKEEFKNEEIEEFAKKFKI